eukprot:2125243-Amphidinium_carterae.1
MKIQERLYTPKDWKIKQNGVYQWFFLSFVPKLVLCLERYWYTMFSSLLATKPQVEWLCHRATFMGDTHKSGSIDGLVCAFVLSVASGPSCSEGGMTGYCTN